MSKGKLTFDELLELADSYGVKDNVLFRSASERYVTQTEMISKIRDQIDADGLMVGHTNVKGDVNMDTHPLVGQLPKYVDTANKTLGVMLDIILKLGTAAPAGDKLGEFLNDQ